MVFQLYAKEKLLWDTSTVTEQIKLVSRGTCVYYFYTCTPKWVVVNQGKPFLRWCNQWRSKIDILQTWCAISTTPAGKISICRKFRLYFNFVDKYLLVTESLRFVQQQPESSASPWLPISVSEMDIYFAMKILQGVVVKFLD